MTDSVDFDAFNELVWTIVRQVPHGKVTTYGQIASMIPCPAGANPDEYPRLAPRWVGSAMNEVSEVSGKEDITIPWHRVINGKGSISLSMDGKAGREQQRRLLAEGVQFDAKDRVDFRKVGWAGPDVDWLDQMGLQAPQSLVKTDPPDQTENPQQLSLF